MKMLLRTIGLAVVHRIGTRIYDVESEQFLGRVLFVPWRGKIQVIGLTKSVRPMFLPQKRLTYWKQTLGFTVHPSPDYPSLEQNKNS